MYIYFFWGGAHIYTHTHIYIYINIINAHMSCSTLVSTLLSCHPNASPPSSSATPLPGRQVCGFTRTCRWATGKTIDFVAAVVSGARSTRAGNLAEHSLCFLSRSQGRGLRHLLQKRERAWSHWAAILASGCVCLSLKAPDKG